MGSNFGPADEVSNPLGPSLTGPSSIQPFALDQAASPSGVTRRGLLKGGIGAAMSGLFRPGVADARSAFRPGSLGFEGVAVSTADQVIVPRGYSVQVLYSWGDATGIATGVAADTVAFSASNTALEQTLQAGMHHDGMHFFPLGRGNHGLLVINHEYTDDGLLHVDGMKTWTPEKVRKAQAAHGVSVIEIQRLKSGNWQVIRPSKYARRITSYTPMRLSGPAAGEARMRTAGDPEGRTVLGTLNNCAHGHTPWGTYLTCEENWNAYFHGRKDAGLDEARYGVKPNGFGYRWHEHDERFDVVKHPNEQHRFGWVVEFDPFNPNDTPVKRTALGRIKHEGALMTTAQDGRAVVYMGDDERFEYIYKFISRDRVRPGGYVKNQEILDHGTLYAARLDDSGAGAWLELMFGKNGLTAANGFTSQADVLIRTRQAADQAGATRMDRPEWIALHPSTGEMFVSLTNNTERGQPGKPGVDRANPRAQNALGQIVRWREQGDAAAMTFRWSQFVLAGDPAASDAALRGTVKGDAFGSPDGLMVDARGLLWIQTDIASTVMGKGANASLGNNQMLAADPLSGEVRRFLVGPRGCELTGIVMSADMRSLFVNIQHPGEPPAERNEPDQPTAVSSWPQAPGIDRPRSSTIVITRDDGGVIGT